MTILKNPPCGFVRAAVLTLGSVWLSGCGQSEAAKIVAVGDGNPKEVAVVIDANRAAEGSAANEAQTTAPIGGATAPPQDSSLTEPTEKEESRFGESAAPSMQGAPPLHSRWGLSVVPHDETPLHVLHDGAISFVGKDLVWLRYRDVPPPLAAEVVFLVTEETEILINGAAAGIEDLRQGMNVTITSEQNGDLFSAKRIEVKPSLV